jgi:hypothetical protein
MSNKSSSRGSQSSHRPKLARASATAPSLATSNASRQDLANLQSTRASTLLTRVASYSSSPENAHHPHHYNCRYSPPSSLCSSPEQHSPTSEVQKQPYGIASYSCKTFHTRCSSKNANWDSQRVTTSASPALKTFRITRRAMTETGDLRRGSHEGNLFCDFLFSKDDMTSRWARTWSGVWRFAVGGPG